MINKEKQEEIKQAMKEIFEDFHIKTPDDFIASAKDPDLGLYDDLKAGVMEKYGLNDDEMGEFLNEFLNNQPLTSDITFEKIKYTGKRKLENQNGYMTDFTFDDVEDYLQEMFDDFNQFVTLTLTEAKNGVRFIQACQILGGILNIQLGLENNEGTKLVEKTCSKEVCISIFKKFYEYSLVDDLDTYKPVKFRM